MCQRRDCKEARAKAAALKIGRGGPVPASPPTDTAKATKPTPVPKYQYINGSGGITVSSKQKKGIIQ